MNEFIKRHSIYGIMTIEKAVPILNALSQCYYRIITEGCEIGCQKCDDCHLCYEKGTIGETARACGLASQILNMIEYFDSDGTIITKGGKNNGTVESDQGNL